MTGGRLRRLGTLGRLATLACLGVLVVGIVGAQSATLATLTVTNTNDSGAGSLRAAITAANAAAGADTITIDVLPTPTGVVTLTPLTPLPTITDPVNISAASSNLDPSGFPYVRVDGSTFGTVCTGSPVVHGLEFNIPIPSTSTLSGLAFTRWTRGNSSAVHITGTGLVTVTGTLIGTDQTGAPGLGSYVGMSVENGSTIGGTGSGDRNIFVGNCFGGLAVSGTGGVVQGNWMGIGPDGATANANGRGVQVGGGTNITIGGTGAGEANLIRGNSGPGVLLFGGTGIEIRGNSIDGNGLGIDLGIGPPPLGGITPNDPGDTDVGPNDLQNFPVLSAATATTVSGSLDTEAGSQTYDIDVYTSPLCDSSGNGEGATLVGSFQVVTTAGSITFPNEPLSGTASGVVTATATDSSGNTSEFSACQPVGGGGEGDPQPGPTFEVNTDADGTPADAGCTNTDCTLREAIVAANAAPTTPVNSITFDFDSSDIVLDTPLPNVTDRVLIDGSNEQAEDEVRIDGSSLAGGDGFVLAAGSGGSTLRDLDITGFGSSGAAAIRISTDTNNIYNNAISSVDSGVFVQDGAITNRIGASDGRGNRIWDFTSFGVVLTAAGAGNLIQANVIGIDGEGAPAAGSNGIAIDNTPGTIVGDNKGPGELGSLNFDLGNVVVAADTEGILIDGEGTAGTIVTANFVGTDTEASATDLGNGIGISVESFSSQNQLGPGNTVAYNGDGGIQVFGGDANRIVANSIYDNGGLGISLLNEANDNLPPATLSGAELNAGTTQVEGEINSTVGRTYYVEVFSNTACDGVGSGEGETFVGFGTVAATEEFQDFSIPIGGLALGQVITTTVTDATTSGTSEFSNCVTVEAGGGEGGSILGSLATTGGSVNLSTVGSEDWAIWGYAGGGTSTSLAPDVRKTGGSAIDDLTDIQFTPAPRRGIGQFPAENPFTFDWTGGFPVTAATGARGGLQHDGQPTPPGTINDGFSFTVPADMTTRTLRVYVSAHWATGRLTATLSDGSAPAYVNSGVVGTRVPEGGNAPGVYTITYSAGSAGEGLNVEWIETVADDPSTGTDNVALYAVALAGGGGGGGELDPPVLFGAVPTGVGSNLGVAGSWDSGLGEDLDGTFDVSFYSVLGPTCTEAAPKTFLFSRSDFETNDGGIGAFAVDGPPPAPVSVGTLVTATVSADDETSGDLQLRRRRPQQHVLAHRVRARPRTRPTTRDALRSSGQARWFKVPILPEQPRRRAPHRTCRPTTTSSSSRTSSRSTTSSSAARRPTQGPNLAHQRPQARRAPRRRSTLQHVAVRPVVLGSDELEAEPEHDASSARRSSRRREYSPTEYSASFIVAHGVLADGVLADRVLADASTRRRSTRRRSSRRSSSAATQWATSNPADPRAFSAAQTASLLAVSVEPGHRRRERLREHVEQHGPLLLPRPGQERVVRSRTAPFTVAVAREGNLC